MEGDPPQAIRRAGRPESAPPCTGLRRWVRPRRARYGAAVSGHGSRKGYGGCRFRRSSRRGQRRFFPKHLDVRDPSHHEHEVSRSVAQDLVGDVYAAAVGVAGFRLHGPTLNRSGAAVIRLIALVRAALHAVRRWPGPKDWGKSSASVNDARTPPGPAIWIGVPESANSRMRWRQPPHGVHKASPSPMTRISAIRRSPASAIAEMAPASAQDPCG